MYELTVGSALAAGLTTALIEAGMTAQRTHQPWSAAARDFTLALVSLYAVVAVAIGLAEALTLGALVASGAVALTRSLLRKIAADAKFDRAVTGSLMATGVSAAAFAGWVSFLALKLVADSHRHLVASVVCGVVALVSLPAFILMAFPVERVTVVLARAIPRLGRLPAAALFVIVAALSAAWRSCRRASNGARCAWAPPSR